MTMYILRTLALSLLLTLVLELGTALVFRVPKKDLMVVVLVNIITNPPFVLAVLFLKTMIAPGTMNLIRACLEILIFAVEGWLYQKYLPAVRHPWLLSLTANALSACSGILLGAVL